MKSPYYNSFSHPTLLLFSHHLHPVFQFLLHLFPLFFLPVTFSGTMSAYTFHYLFFPCSKLHLRYPALLYSRSQHSLRFRLEAQSTPRHRSSFIGKDLPIILFETPFEDSMCLGSLLNMRPDKADILGIRKLSHGAIRITRSLPHLSCGCDNTLRLQLPMEP